MKRLLSIITIFLQFFFYSCSDYKIEQKNQISNLEVTEKDYKTKIKSAEIFSENYINSYLDFIRKEILRGA